MHGAGNDFLLVDDRSLAFPSHDVHGLCAIAARRTGVGCDGIILIQESDSADFRMRFINPDGLEVEMCGNGARCVARLAHELGLAPESMVIDTCAGPLGAEIVGKLVRLHMTAPHGWRLAQKLEVDGQEIAYDFVNTGVPHVVIKALEVDNCPVRDLGRRVRHHDSFAPTGTNVNFVAPTDLHSIVVRTYERGVEDETLACGTGAAACALIAARHGWIEPPVEVTVRSGDVLTIDFKLHEGGAEDVTLLGPTAHVYQGTIEYRPSGRV